MVIGSRQQMQANALTITAFLILPVGFAPSLTAQDEDPGAEQLVDRVVAIVGDSAILMTEVDQQFELLKQRGWQVPTDFTELRQAQLRLLDQLINEQLLLQDAARDTLIVVEDAELESRVEQEIEERIRQIGTQGRFQEMLLQQGFTMASFRENRKEFFRRQLTRERYLAKRRQSARDVLVTEGEVDEFYQLNLNLMPQRPATVRFENYRLKPQASDTAMESAMARAREVLVEARRDGSDFAELARRHSMGPTREQGGELGWVRRGGGFAKPFEDAVFASRAGIVSEPVETEFGLHLILVERIRGGERRVRHILFRPTVTSEDAARNLVRAEEVFAAVESGDTGAAVLQDVPVDTLEVPINQLGQLSNFYARELSNAEAGDVRGPLPIDDPSTDDLLGVARVLEVREGGVATVDDMRPQIEAQLRQNRILEQVVAELRSRTYIDNRLATGG